MESHTKPTFSVVIPTRNERDDITATLRALAAQTQPAHEIVIVDDSTDDTREIVAGHFAILPQLRLRPGTGRGRCEARNVGICEAAGDVAIVLNADVILPPDFIERLEPHYEEG